MGGNDNEPVPETGDPPANLPGAPTLQEATQEGEVAVATPTAPVTVMEVGADRPEYVATEAGRRLDFVYGDHPHQNGKDVGKGSQFGKSLASGSASVIPSGSCCFLQ